MSILTQCPACSTVYRVVPDQLRISDGWVKCGQCADIFDASRHLMEAMDAPLVQGQFNPSPGLNSTVETGNIAQTTPTDEPAAENRATQNTTQPNCADPSAASVATPNDIGHLTPESTPEETLADQAAQDSIATDSLHEQAPPPNEIHQATQLRWNDNIDDVPTEQGAAEENTLEPSFLTQGTEIQPRQSPWVRMTLLASTILLMLALVSQWLYTERDQIAAQYPEMKGAMSFFCSLSNCTLDALHRIESLSVDSVTFSQLEQNSYRLNFVIKNSSALALAMPAVELSLTDAQDQPTYRRILAGKDMGKSYSKEIAANSEKNFSIALQVKADNTESAVRGYRLLIFYP